MAEATSNARRTPLRTPQTELQIAAPALDVPAIGEDAQPPLGLTGSKAAGAKVKGNSASILATTVFSAAVLATLFAGWKTRHELYIVPGTGAGYWIGIAGSLMMLSLLLYPLRKKYARIAGLGRMLTWFKSHMITGILGPLLVILHSNFELKSVNATIATIVMLTVVASGITGRFLYSKVHKGLYGKRAELKALLSEAEAFKQAFGSGMQAVPETMAELKACEDAILKPDQSTFQCLLQLFNLGFRTRANRKVLRGEMQNVLSARALREHWDNDTYKQRLAAAHQHLDLYGATIRKAAGLKFYSRLLAWWHVLHFPLFLLLIFVTVVHVVAVHFY